MPPFGPVSRRKLIDSLRRAGFAGPYAGGKHALMVRAERTPSPTRTAPTSAETCSGTSYVRPVSAAQSGRLFDSGRSVAPHPD